MPLNWRRKLVSYKMSGKAIKKKTYFLVDPDTIKVGDSFEIIDNETCNSCRYYNICFGDKKIGLNYKVTKILKPKENIYCKLIEKRVYLAEVEEAPVRLTVLSANLVVDVPVTYTPIRCAEKHCPYIKYCVYNGSNLGTRIIVNKVISKLDCPIGLDLFLVEARPPDD